MLEESTPAQIADVAILRPSDLSNFMLLQNYFFAAKTNIFLKLLKGEAEIEMKKSDIL